jgi:hypothetical protein
MDSPSLNGIAFNGKPQATAAAITVACRLPLNDQANSLLVAHLLVQVDPSVDCVEAAMGNLDAYQSAFRTTSSSQSVLS